MARQVLENGVVLPAEYSDDWYDDMTSNLTKLDDVIGSDSEKLSSADVGAAALSNNYNDLDNLPTIPTVNDATLTIQKNGVDVQTFTANASSNVTANITVPTKTSDLTNDSNFVDTSNSAVASGITSAKVTSYDSHIADTDIHVTTADKTKWNNGVSQSYVLRYSSSSVTDNSTIAYSTLDNTDNVKSGDKVIDVDGKIFSVVSVDTTNQTVTVGSALIDLALDANVVHTSGNETVGGIKTFDSNTLIYNSDATATTPNLYLRSSKIEISSQGNTSGDQNLTYLDKNNTRYAYVKGSIQSNGTAVKIGSIAKDSSDNSVINELQILANTNGNNAVFPSYSNEIYLGLYNYKWKGIYATNYYYGSNNVEFSTKFVTTDTAQTISGGKTFSSPTRIYNASASVQTDVPSLVFKNSLVERASTTLDGEQTILFTDKNDNNIASIQAKTYTSGISDIILTSYSENDGVKTTGIMIRRTPTTSKLQGYSDNITDLGDTNRRWRRVYATSYYYGSDNVEFSTKFVTTDTNQTISGNKTFSSINGVEPSSLSLPSDRSARIDISSYFTNTGTGDTNTYTVPANGYINLQLTDAVAVHCFSSTSNNLTNFCQTFSRASDGMVYVLFPVRKNDVFKTTWYTSTTVNVGGAYFVPCQGNV